MRIDFSSINLDNKKIKDLQKYTLWYNFFHFGCLLGLSYIY